MVSQDVDIVLEQAAASPEISQSKAYQAMSECKESLARVVQNSEDETALGTLVYDFVDKFLYAYDSGEASKLRECCALCSCCMPLPTEYATPLFQRQRRQLTYDVAFASCLLESSA